MYISEDKILDGYDKSIGSYSMNGLFYVDEINTGWVEENIEGFQPGVHYLIIVVDKKNILTETNEENNTLVVPITINNCNNSFIKFFQFFM